MHPRESIVILRGKKGRNNVMVVTDLLIPPIATHGHGFASLPLHMLHTDFSILGTAHSHPSGSLKPSPVDLNHFFGAILIIIGYPYVDERNVAAYDREGTRLGLHVVSDQT